MKMFSNIRKKKKFINVSLHDSASTKKRVRKLKTIFLYLSIYILLSLLVKLFLGDDKNTKEKLVETPFLPSSHGFNELLTSFTFVVIEHDNVAVMLGIRRKVSLMFF